jgi:hypothetical protein
MCTCSMDGNPHFADLQPLLTSLREATTIYIAAMAKTQSGFLRLKIAGAYNSKAKRLPCPTADCAVSLPLSFRTI